MMPEISDSGASTVKSDAPDSLDAAPRSRRVWCLADLFNLRLWPSIPGRPTSADVKDGLEQLVSATSAIALSMENSADVDEIAVRIYGGWWFLGESKPSKTRRLLESAIRDMPGGRRPRVLFSIAESPVSAPGLRLMSTVRWSPLKASDWIVFPTIRCRLGGACSLESFSQSWLATGACPHEDCGVSLKDRLAARRQKTVDTLLSVDALHVARDVDTACVVVASDDDDMVPCLLTARTTTAASVVWMRRSAETSVYSSLTESAGIRTRQW